MAKALLQIPEYRSSGFPHDLVSEAFRIADEFLRQRNTRPLRDGCDWCEDAKAEGWVVEQKEEGD